MLTSANTSRTGRSVLEAAVGQPIVHFEDLRLTDRLLATEGEEADLVLIQIHFTTNQAGGPPLAQTQAHPQDPPQGVGVTMRAVEDHVVVELGIGGQAGRTPVLHQRRDGPFGGHRRRDRPGGGQAPCSETALSTSTCGPSLMT